jgi:long-chain acyl-CoA synthetase
MLYGANRPHNVALVVIDALSVAEWAKEKGIGESDLEKNPQVRALIQSELQKYSTEFKRYERPQDLVLISEDFTTENDMLTPKMSLKRRKVLAKYGPLLDALFES